MKLIDCQLINITEIAWATGLFDGEGCVTTLYPKRSQVRLEIQMVHKPTLERFARAVGGNVHKSYEHRRKNRIQWRWRVCDNDALSIARKLLPYSCEKKRTNRSNDYV